jgi:hypothetical protein
VVVDFFPGLLATRPRFNAALWPHLAGLRDVTRIAYQARDPLLAAQSLAAWAFPTYGLRRELREAVLSAARGSPSALRLQTAAYRVNWSSHRGAQIETQTGLGGDTALGADRTAARLWHCRPENQGAVREFLELACGRGINVYWLIPPNRTDPAGAAHGAAMQSAYDAFIRAVQTDFPDLVIVDARREAYPQSAFLDPVHLNVRGASQLSRSLAERVLRTEETRGLAWRKPGTEHERAAR